MKGDRVLMVDDDPIILKFVTANLKARGYEVITAEDGYAALAAMEKDMPKLVLLDLLMPGLDGFEVCRRIRQRSDVPIIVLTAIGETKARAELLSLGADDYLTKPFDIVDLLNRVKNILGSSTNNHTCAN